MRVAFHHLDLLVGLLLVLSLVSVTRANNITTNNNKQPPLHLDCDPCIRRPDFVVKAIVHGTKDDIFWVLSQAAMQQAALDMNVQLELDLYDVFDPVQMANDIAATTTRIITNEGEERLDALIVTIPSPILHDAIQQVVEMGLPVFGFNVGYEVFEALGVLGFVAQHEYQAGVQAAEEFIRLASSLNINDASSNNDESTFSGGDFEILLLPENQTLTRTSNTIQKALFVNHQIGNQALDDRFLGFKESLLQSNPNIAVEEIVVDLNAREPLNSTIDQAMQACLYDIVLSGGSSIATTIVEAAARYDCQKIKEGGDNPSIIATFDLTTDLQRYILLEQLAFALPQQDYLQAALPVIFAVTYATTSNAIVPTIELKTYSSGPVIVNKDNLPPDSLKTCEEEAFPICPNTQAPNGGAATCDCIDRKKIRIGGVLHGHTSDLFWDPIYLAAENAAEDMGVQLENERFSPEDDSDILANKMAAQMRTLCESGIDGLFVTIPESQAIYDAIQICQLLNIPVIAVNSNPKVSEEVGVQHIGQDEYGAGYLSGQKMLEAGMTEGYCLGNSVSSGVTARCTGFVDAIAEQGDGFKGTIIDAPLDLDSRFALVFKEAVGKDGHWSGVGWLVGARHLEPTLGVQEEHANLLIGISDVGSYSDIIFKALDEKKLLFTFDQQPFLQGNLPVYLLTYLVYTNQRLLDKIILTGPSFITARPTPEQQSCETQMWDVCQTIPVEDLNYISVGWLGVGYFFAGLTVFSGVVCLVWLVVYRRKKVVTASQPPFLGMVALGAIVSGCAIIPMGIETGYRITRDPFTGDIAGLNRDIDQVDAACMAVPWLYGIGFTLMFGGLLAKIWRIQLIFKAALEMRRQTVSYTDVLFVIAGMFVVELSILISWQVVSPHEWRREVTNYSFDGYPLESVGSCDSDSGWYFMAGLVSFHIVCLFYALILCWQARHIPPDFADSSWVSLSVIMIFQVSILAIPVAAMVREETDVFYFIRACALFLQSFSVLCLVFVPKVYRTAQGDDTVRVSRATDAGRSSAFSKSRNSAILESQNAQDNSKHFERNSMSFPVKSFADESAERAPLMSSCCDSEIISTCASCGRDVTGKNRRPSTERVQPIKEEGSESKSAAPEMVAIANESAEVAECFE